ncbi:sigma-70 family RNA polymerase sigma factor [Streptomonospora nanhaiensis]|uniref:DNA-directed RNA polymerase specialized sigma24 family protein n=1 Tax=Streptomonospora nanhaiensis TaxID=1323731 RepID=A0A853BJ73_9ACTN|nr:sigma-70 family RNA polymerase sigma factor [Streptomonospora nanhaiensis]MBV2364119.1 sigma-70 family RNA polymerase sigma factor [Streptomonospora nanhaiensis]MBX9388484.1 sigma-70 family RNA polymerase sigma factor [Streptomonospora nanhaiensis]NYI95070.1 DNA-directed RNA polymerase specialized sigma24 family protein [Streptomonospora nanhaiensis]
MDATHATMMPPSVAPLRAAERTFDALADRLWLEPRAPKRPEKSELVPPVAMDLRQARAWLLQPEVDHRKADRLWRLVIARARAEEAWMTVAVGPALPGVRGAARRTCRGLNAEQAADVEAEMLAAFVVAVGTVNTGWTRLAWRLRCRAQRAGMRARHRELLAPVVQDRLEETEEPARPGGHPDLVLARAVAAGVLPPAESELIGRTRLEDTTLRTVAAELGVEYKTLHKRRSRAEARLARALTAQGALSAAGGGRR